MKFEVAAFAQQGAVLLLRDGNPLKKFANCNCINSGSPCLSLQQQPQHHHHVPQQQAQAQPQAQPAQQPQQQQQARQMSGGMAGSQQRYTPPAQAPGSSLPASVAQLPSSLAGVNTSSAGQSMGHMPQVRPAAPAFACFHQAAALSGMCTPRQRSVAYLRGCAEAPSLCCLQGVHRCLMSMLTALQMPYGPASGMPPGMSQYAYMPQYAASQYPAAYMPQAAYYAAAMPGNQYGGYAPPQGYAPNQPATSYAGGSGFGNHSYGKQQHSSYNHGEAAACLHDACLCMGCVCVDSTVLGSTACISCLHGAMAPCNTSRQAVLQAQGT